MAMKKTNKKEFKGEFKKGFKQKPTEESSKKLNLIESIYPKLYNPDFLFKVGVSASCIFAIVSLIVSDFGMLRNSSAGVCCYSNCYVYECQCQACY